MCFLTWRNIWHKERLTKRHFGPMTLLWLWDKPMGLFPAGLCPTFLPLTSLRARGSGATWSQLQLWSAGGTTSGGISNVWMCFGCWGLQVVLVESIQVWLGSLAGLAVASRWQYINGIYRQWILPWRIGVEVKSSFWSQPEIKGRLYNLEIPLWHMDSNS